MTTLVLGDCLKVMATLPDKSVDCFVCDLPYGQLHTTPLPSQSHEKYGNSPNKVIGGCPWDIKINLDDFWKQVKRLAKNDHTPVIMFCNTKFGVELINSNPKWFRYDLVWNKMRGVSFLSANKMPMKAHEMIYVFSKKGAFYNRIDVEGKPYFKKSKNQTNEQYGVERVEGDNKGTRCALSVISAYGTAGHRGGIHPTAKPIELYKWLLSRYCPKDGLVLDPTAGSFNSVLAAKSLGFKSIGIEMNNSFYWNGVKKLESLTIAPLPQSSG